MQISLTDCDKRLTRFALRRELFWSRSLLRGSRATAIWSRYYVRDHDRGIIVCGHWMLGDSQPTGLIDTINQRCAHEFHVRRRTFTA